MSTVRETGEVCEPQKRKQRRRAGILRAGYLVSM